MDQTLITRTALREFLFPGMYVRVGGRVQDCTPSSKGCFEANISKLLCLGNISIVCRDYA